MQRKENSYLLVHYLLSLSLLLQIVAPLFPYHSFATAVATTTDRFEETETRRQALSAHASRSPLSNFFADLNGDQRVDESDLTRIGESWDCLLADPCYSTDFDFNNDGVIDALDLATVGNEYDIDPPIITITSPATDAVLTDLTLTVAGTVTDRHAVSELLVNGVSADLIPIAEGFQFTAVISATEGVLPLHISAADEIGQVSNATRLITIDHEGPYITVNHPAPRQSVYTTRPTIDIAYTDLIAAVDPATLLVTLTDENGVITDVTSQLSAGSDTASGTLTTDLQEDQSYSMTVTIADTNGVIATYQSDFYVPLNANSLTPPVTAVGDGFVSGYVFDSTTCDGTQAYDPITCNGIAGAHVTLEQIDADAMEDSRQTRLAHLESDASPHGLPHQATADSTPFRATTAGVIVTGPEGFFAFPVDTTGNYSVRVEKDGFTYGQRLVGIVREKSTAMTHVYLTPLDPAVTPCDQTGCQHTSADSQMKLDIPAGAIPAGETLDIRATEFDQVQFLPSGELPPGTGETYAFNLSGASEITFTMPVTVMVRNSRGFDPSTNISLGYWNQHLQVWEDAGDATVNETGEWLVMQVTHFSNFDPNDPVTIATADVKSDDRTIKPAEDCVFDCATSQVNLSGGGLRQSFSLPSVDILDASEMITLQYDSQRANATAVIDLELGLEALTAGGLGEFDLIQAELFIEGESTQQFSFRIDQLTPDGEIGRFRYFWDGRDAQGRKMPPGVYFYSVRIKIPYEAEFFGTTNGRFGGPADPSQPLGITTTATLEDTFFGSILINQDIGGHYGYGWQIADVQQLHIKEDGALLIDDGNGVLTQYLLPRTDLLDEDAQVRTIGRELSTRDVSNDTELDQLNDDRFAIVERQSTRSIQAATVDITTDIVTDTVWTVANSPYRILNDITISSTATLTVEAGVEVRIDRADDLFVEGTLLAQGTELTPVTITSDNSNAWGAIIVQNGGTADLTHTNLSNGGQSSESINGRDAGLVVLNSTLVMSQTTMTDMFNTTNVADGCIYAQDSQLTLFETTLQGCSSTSTSSSVREATAALALLGDTTTIQARNLVITESHLFPLALDIALLDRIPAAIYDKSQARVFAGTLTENVTLSQTVGISEFVYENDITVPSGTTLTVNEGISWSAIDPNDNFLVEGTLITRGTAGNPVLLTSQDNSGPSEWGGILVDGGTAELDFTTIQFGGRLSIDGSHNAALGVINNGTLQFTNSALLQNSDTATTDDSYLHVADSTAVVRNSVLSDDGLNAANPNYGIILQDSGGLDFTYENNVLIHQGAQIQAPLAVLNRLAGNNTFTTGGVQRFVATDSTISTPTTLDAIGDLAVYQFDNNITFTDDVTVTAGTTIRMDNRAVRINGGTLTAVGTLDEPIIFDSFDGDPDSWNGIILENGAFALLKFTQIKDAFRGIDLQEGGLDIQQSLIQNNSAAITVFGEPTSFLARLNDFGDNTFFGMLNDTSVQIDARLNYWGSPLGPQHPDNPGGDGDRIGSNVLFEPFLSSSGQGVEGSTAVNLSPHDTTAVIFDEVASQFVRTYPDGRTVIFNSDGQHIISRDPVGNEWQYSYNSDGSLNTISYLANGRPSADWVWSFGYQTVRAASDVTQHRTPVNRTTITDPAGRVTTLDLDKNGNLVALQEPGLDTPMTFAYAAQSQMTHKTSARGDTTTYEYDENGRVIRALLPPREIFDPTTGQFSVEQEIHDFAPRDTQNTINSLDIASPDSPNNALIQSDSLESQQAINGRLFTHTTNQFGAQTGYVDPQGQQTVIERDDRDRMVKRITPLGHCTLFTYDAFDNILTRTEMDTAACNGGVGQSRTVTSTYDLRFNQLQTITDFNGETITFVYDYEVGLGEAGLLVEKRFPAVDDGTGNIVTPIESYGYNQFGQRTTVTDTLGIKTCYVYTTGDASEANTIFAAGVSPVPGLMTQVIEDCGGTLARTTTFREFDAAGNAQIIEEPFGELVPNGGHDIRVTTQRFDDRDRPIEITDVISSVTRFAYDNGDNLIQLVEDATGRPVTTTMRYDAVDQQLGLVLEGADGSQVETVYGYSLDRRQTLDQDANGNVTTYQYDNLNRLTHITDPLGHAQTFTYDADNRLIAETDGRGTITAYQYDGLNRPITRTVDPAGLSLITVMTYDDNSNILTQTDPNGVVTCYVYDALDRVTSITEDCGGLNATRQIVYDLRDSVIKRIDPLGRTELRQNDALNRITVFTDPLGQTETAVYDAADNVTALTNEGNHTTFYTFDARDRQLTVTDVFTGVTRFEYDNDNNLTKIVDQLGHTTEMRYDDLDRMIEHINEQGASRFFTYDNNGNPLSEIDELGQITYYQYDSLNRESSRIDPLGHIASMAYDEVGNVIQIEDEIGNTLQMSYDRDHRLIQTTDPRGDLFTMTYDGVGNQLTHTDPQGNTVAHLFDNLYRQTMLTDPNEDSTLFTYDLVGNLRTLTDPHGNTTTMTYDDLDRLVTETDALGQVTTRVYDALSNLTQLTDRNGRVRQFIYDDLSRLEQEIWVDGNYQSTQTYDAASRLTSASDPFAHYDLTYDEVGRLLTYDETGAGNLVPFGFSYTYDDLGNTTEMIERINGSVTATTAYLYDVKNRPSQIAQSGTAVAEKRVTFAYNSRGYVSEVSRFASLDATQSAVESRMVYDAEGQLVNLTHTPANNAPIVYQFVFDSSDRLSSMSHTADGNSTFSYDDFGQLITADHANQADENYSYDATGNRTNHTIGADNRVQNDGTFSYQYDNEGNRTSRTHLVTGEVTEYSYDFHNRLIEVTHKDSADNLLSSVSYVYNVFGERISRQDSEGKEQQFAVYDGRVFLTFDGAGTVTNRYLQAPIMDWVLADEQVATGELLFPLEDHLRTARDLVDSSGTLVNHREYDSFGNLIGETDSSVSYLFGFTGRERDPLTDLNYYRARYYDAQIGRFINQDPLQFAAGDPNLYRYVNNAPLSYTDPNGMTGISPEFQMPADFPMNSSGKNRVAGVVKPITNKAAQVVQQSDVAVNGLKGKIFHINPNNPDNIRLQQIKRAAAMPPSKEEVERLKKVQAAMQARIDKAAKERARLRARTQLHKSREQARKKLEQMMKTRSGRATLAAKKFALKVAGKLFGAVDAAIMYNDAMLQVLGVAEAHNRFARAARRERERELRRRMNDAAVRQRNEEIRKKNAQIREERRQAFLADQRFEQQFEDFVKKGKGLFGAPPGPSSNSAEDRLAFEIAREKAKQAPDGPAQETADPGNVKPGSQASPSLGVFTMLAEQNKARSQLGRRIVTPSGNMARQSNPNGSGMVVPPSSNCPPHPNSRF